jgi:hypothetical protein
MQEQIKKLLSNVLDVLSPNEPVQKKMVKFYSEHNSNSLELFQFTPQPTNFEMVAGDIFTEVLYPNDIYDMIDFFLRACIKKEQPFRVCKSCGKYFAITCNSSYFSKTISFVIEDVSSIPTQNFKDILSFLFTGGVVIVNSLLLPPYWI